MKIGRYYTKAAIEKRGDRIQQCVRLITKKEKTVKVETLKYNILDGLLSLIGKKPKGISPSEKLAMQSSELYNRINESRRKFLG